MRDLIEQIPIPKAEKDVWQGFALPPDYQPLHASAAPCWFVDGGNAEILGAPHFSLQKLRVVAIRLPDKHHVKAEKTVLIRKANVGWEILSEHEKPQFLPVPELGEVITHVRQQLEHELALTCNTADELIVMDGDVAPPGVIALQKTNAILTQHNFPLTSVLTRPGPWYAALGRMHAVKLDPRARHVFLVHGATATQLAILMHYSLDSLFPGYPYGLVLADRLARVSKEEASALRVHAQSMLKDLAIHITNAEASSDSHKILDTLG